MFTCDPLVFANSNVSDYVVEMLGERCQSVGSSLPSELFQASIVIPTLIIYPLIFILGVIGNICTCIVICANKSMHNPTNFYLFSLAISDILVLVLGLPMELYGVLDYSYPYMFGDIVCKARAFLIEFTSYASVLIICCFSVERWLAICYPLRVKLFSTISRAYILIIAAWALSFLCALPMAFIVKVNRIPIPDFARDEPWFNQITKDGVTVVNTDFCSMDVHQQERQKTLINFAFFAFFLIPALVITVMYSQIAVKLMTADSYLDRDRSFNSKRGKSTKNVMKMLVSVVVTFFLCWLPFHIQRLLSVLMNDHQGNVSPTIQFLSHLVFYISGYCYYSNSACNPILYNVLSEKYRRAFCITILGDRMTKRIFPKWHDKNKSHLHAAIGQIACHHLRVHSSVAIGSRTNVDHSSLTHKGSTKHDSPSNNHLLRSETPKPVMV